MSSATSSIMLSIFTSSSYSIGVIIFAWAVSSLALCHKLCLALCHELCHELWHELWHELCHALYRHFFIIRPRWSRFLSRAMAVGLWHDVDHELCYSILPPSRPTVLAFAISFFTSLQRCCTEVESFVPRSYWRRRFLTFQSYLLDQITPFSSLWFSSFHSSFFQEHHRHLNVFFFEIFISFALL